MIAILRIGDPESPVSVIALSLPALQIGTKHCCLVTQIGREMVPAQKACLSTQTQNLLPEKYLLNLQLILSKTCS